VDSIRICLSLKSCVGIAGGRPNSSLYFIGTEGDNLIYLDPHHVRPAIPPKDVNSYDKVDIFGYHCAKIRLLSFSAMDPSMVVGFYFKNQDDFEQFRTLSKMVKIAKLASPRK
jgi:cysteine protease ATG4